ncbi:MAG: prepilin-type N-terminal cleavage/methylation domain-containing protein [Magnetococcales bacterium]|nr:prepilin-type N-terminal cleavage/methylation domain-containing protein [Magnetococcales bacterium]
MAGSVKFPTPGFTLLEALIALSISALIMTGVYRVVNGGVSQSRLMEQRAETLHLWNHLKRVLSRDLEHLIKEPPARMIREGNDTLILRCHGAIIPDWRLGARVEVIYRWRPDPDGRGMIWERLVKPLDGKREDAKVTLKIADGLIKSDYALLDAQEWRPNGDGAQPPWRALRWQFEWRDIGPWTLVRNLLPLPGAGAETKP